VDYVELDPLAAQLQLRFGLLTPFDGLTVIAQDARAYLSRTSTRYDAILVSLPEPETFQVNRFYTAGFFNLAKNHLCPRGCIQFRHRRGGQLHLSGPATKLSSLANTAGDYFKHVTLMPGQRLMFICRDRPIQTDIPLLLEQKGIDTHHIRRYYEGDLTEPADPSNQRRRGSRHRAKPGSVSPVDAAGVRWMVCAPRGVAGWFALALSVAGALAYMIRISRPNGCC
jgi:spermidine synthase